MIVAAALGALLAPRNCPPRMCADPLDSDAAWLRSEDVRYGGAARSGRGYCASYLPFTLAGNHSRAVLLLGEPGPELRGVAARLALYARGGSSTGHAEPERHANVTRFGACPPIVSAAGAPKPSRTARASSRTRARHAAVALARTSGGSCSNGT